MSKAASSSSKVIPLLDVYLVCDTREKEVTPFISDVLRPCEAVIKQITIGDYMILRKNKTARDPDVLAVLERKTWKDFAHSLCDGRYGNLAKLLDLRAHTGCLIFFIIEGTPAFPDPCSKISRVPF